MEIEKGKCDLKGSENVVKKSGLMFLMLILTVGLLAGCGGAGGGNAKKELEKEPQKQSQEPVTLIFYDPSSSVLEEDFMNQYGNAIQKKFPYITVKYVHSPDTNPEGHIANLIAAGEPIDVFLNADLNHYRLITPFHLEYDISELIKSHKYDLSRLEPSAVQAVKALSKGGMYSLPYKMSAFALMYNKDLFDKFGVPYPKDGMTWDQVYNVARTMTRLDAGVQYRGFITQFYNFAWLNQLSVGFVDPKTDKALYSSDDRWDRFTKNLSRFYEIPGNEVKEGNFGSISNLFNKDKVAAMYAYYIPTTEQQVNWDVVRMPEFSGLPGVGSQANLQLAYVTSLSKHKDAAFDAIAYMTSDEYQMNISKQGLGFPITNNQEVKNSFGQDAAALKGKNVQTILKSKPASPSEGSPYSRTAGVEYEKIMYQVGKGAIDVNTALRTAAEKADAAIAAMKSEKK